MDYKTTGIDEYQQGNFVLPLSVLASTTNTVKKDLFNVWVSLVRDEFGV